MEVLGHGAPHLCSQPPRSSSQAEAATPHALTPMLPVPLVPGSGDGHSRAEAWAHGVRGVMQPWPEQTVALGVAQWGWRSSPASRSGPGNRHVTLWHKQGSPGGRGVAHSLPKAGGTTATAGGMETRHVSKRAIVGAEGPSVSGGAAGSFTTTLGSGAQMMHPRPGERTDARAPPRPAPRALR